MWLCFSALGTPRRIRKVACMSTGGWHRFSGRRKKKGGSNCKNLKVIGEDNDMITDPVIEVRPKKNKNVTVAPPPRFFFTISTTPNFFSCLILWMILFYRCSTMNQSKPDNQARTEVAARTDSEVRSCMKPEGTGCEISAVGWVSISF